MLFGLSEDTWEDMYRLYMMDIGQPPKDLFEIRRHWQNYRKETPEDCFRIGARLTEAHHHYSDASAVFDMIHRFMVSKS